MTPVDEFAVAFACGGDRLVGVIAHPPAPATRGVVVVVGGPQYRAGSHRQFVHLARRLAAEGYPTLRFDYRGMGDSSGAARPFDAVDDDIAAAIDALHAACPGVREIVLWGLCDAASAAAIYANRRDPRVTGIALVNPWARDAATHATAQVKHYYAGRLLSRAWWQRLARGDVDVRAALRDFAGTLARALRGGRRDAPPEGFRSRMASGVDTFTGRLLLVLSGQDLTAREFEAHAAAEARWQRALARAAARRCAFPSADHTFSRTEARRAAEDATLAWLRSW